MLNEIAGQINILNYKKKNSLKNFKTITKLTLNWSTCTIVWLIILWKNYRSLFTFSYPTKLTSQIFYSLISVVFLSSYLPFWDRIPKIPVGTGFLHYLKLKSKIFISLFWIFQYIDIHIELIEISLTNLIIHLISKISTISFSSARGSWALDTQNTNSPTI